jgi:hypothetical protein
MADYDNAVILERLRAVEIELNRLRAIVETFGLRLADTGYMQAWALVQLTEDLEVAGHAAARVWLENDDGSLTLSGADATIVVWSPKYHKTLVFASGKEGIALRWYRRWWWIGGECPE